ncbi:hypothetical protein MNBD_GAMMA23-1277 [hydrothermal vent metagenome]|uniref:Uncharacterized protein n=1 Tax=hydrothermal vent metagenome TaxID=652676 RepID=A0A3B1AT13_9ZZZZ
MKLLIYITIFMFLQTACATENKFGSIKSDKLKITVQTHDGKPESWLRFYNVDVAEENEHEKRIGITAEFNIPNVTDMIITDMNAVNKKCGKKYGKHFLYLSFNPSNNLRKITTRIHLPCMVENKAVFKLVVKTADGGRYYNITTLTAHPDAFDAVYKD